MECQLGGGADQIFNALRVFDTGKLHQNTVIALTLDGGFFCTGFVNPAADNLDGLV